MKHFLTFATVLTFALLTAPAQAVETEHFKIDGMIDNWYGAPAEFTGDAYVSFEDGRLLTATLATNIGIWGAWLDEAAGDSWFAKLYDDGCVFVAITPLMAYVTSNAPSFFASSALHPIAAVPEAPAFAMLALGIAAALARRRERA